MSIMLSPGVMMQMVTKKMMVGIVIAQFLGVGVSWLWGFGAHQVVQRTPHSQCLQLRKLIQTISPETPQSLKNPCKGFKGL